MTRERPRICPRAYEQLSKTAIYLACVDMIAIGLEKETDEITDADVLAEVKERADLLRAAGWSTHPASTSGPPYSPRATPDNGGQGSLPGRNGRMRR